MEGGCHCEWAEPFRMAAPRGHQGGQAREIENGAQLLLDAVVGNGGLSRQRGCLAGRRNFGTTSWFRRVCSIRKNAEMLSGEQFVP
jgi:hypothetical protein